MKKITSLLLCAMMGISLCACGSSETKEEKGESGTVEKKETSKKTTLDESVVYDENDIKITVKGLDIKGVFGPEINLLIENNSGTNYTVQVVDSSVNGYMIEPVMSSDVAAGKKANSSITFTESYLEAADIENFANFEFKFRIFNTDTWEDYFDSNVITLNTSIADEYDYSFDESGEVVYDENGVKVVVKGLTDQNIFGPGVLLYIVNNSNQDITVQADNSSVNGFMVEDYMSADVLVGKHCITDMTFLSTELEENDITEVKDVEFTLHIFDKDSWETIKDTDTIKVSF